MKNFGKVLAILVIAILTSTSLSFGNSITSSQQLLNQIKKDGLQKPIREALIAGTLSGDEICTSAFRANKGTPMQTAEILTKSGIPKMDIIKAGIKAGVDIQVIAQGIKKGANTRRWIPVCGNIGGDDPDDNPISNVKPWKKKKRIKNSYCDRW